MTNLVLAAAGLPRKDAGRPLQRTGTMNSMRGIALAWLAAGWPHLAAQELTMSAEDYYQQVMRNPNFKIEGRVTGEDFCRG